METQQTYLPLGTVVRLKEGTKLLMIYGRVQKLPNDKEYDYLGCPFPEGFINPEKSFVFNHNVIDEIIHEGYRDESEELIQQLLLEHRPLTVGEPVKPSDESKR